MANILEPYFEELVEEKTFSRAFHGDEDSCQSSEVWYHVVMW